MSKLNAKTMGRALAALICVVGFSLTPGCSNAKCCGKDGQCCKQSAKKCGKGCKCTQCASAKKCSKGCAKKCCKKA